MAEDRHQKTEVSAADDLVARALTCLRHGYFADARAHMRAYLAYNKREAKHYRIEGLAALAMADWPAARDLFVEACADFPDQAQFWFNRGLAEENLEQLDAAADSYCRSLALKPGQGEAFGNLANIYRRQGRFPEAAQMACRALAAGAPQADALNVLALALGRQGNFSEAEKALDAAIALSPANSAFHANRANLAVDQLKFDEAWGHFAQARALADNAVFKRDEGMARLLAGDYTQGLPLYEARLDLPKALRLHPGCPRWKGENLSGKTLLLVSEQGFGDTIQFGRYAHKLREAGANLIWSVRPPLQRLLAMNVPGQVLTEEDIMFGQDGEAYRPLAGTCEAGVKSDLGVACATRIGGGIYPQRQNFDTSGASPSSIPSAGGREAPHALPQPDFWLPILSLPFALGMTEAVPMVMPLFRSPALPRLPDAPGRRKIGLVWSGSRTHERDHERSIPLDLLAPVWEKIDAQFYAPFKGAAGVLADGVQRPIVMLDNLIADFADMAALLSQLDGLITVDTAAAHLAGALRLPAWLLLPHCPDWRWGASGETARWYESVTLLRQRRYGDWENVVDRLVEQLGGI